MTTMYINYRGANRRVIALDPNDIIYPNKITINTNFVFVGWKNWKKMLKYGNDISPTERLPLELGKLLKYKLHTREEHNNIIMMLRSEDMESVYLAHRTIEGLKNIRHGKK